MSIEGTKVHNHHWQKAGVRLHTEQELIMPGLFKGISVKGMGHVLCLALTFFCYVLTVLQM